MPSSNSRKADSPAKDILKLKLAHSPDSDDAFMFYGLATRKIPTGNLQFTHVLEDIETLNQKAKEEVYDITAVSFHAYAYLADRYLLLPSGASFGDRYGPVVVARKQLGPAGLKGMRVAVPGKLTTAFLALQLYEQKIIPRFVPFDRVLEAVAKGEVDAGVIIHEGQLTYSSEGFTKIVDLGEWWYQQTKMPLPLGGNAVKRSHDLQTILRISTLLKASIQYSLDHREEALAYAMQFARGLDTTTADKFVGMYVNDWTVDYGERGRKAIQLLLDIGHQKGILPKSVTAEIAGP